MFTLKLVLFLCTIHASVEKVVTLTICSISLIVAGDGEVLFTIVSYDLIRLLTLTLGYINGVNLLTQVICEVGLRTLTAPNRSLTATTCTCWWQHNS